MKKAAKKAPKRKDNNPATAVRLPRDLKKDAVVRAEQENRTLSNLIITAVKKYIEN
jgi:predicted DNA-binding protein